MIAQLRSKTQQCLGSDFVYAHEAVTLANNLTDAIRIHGDMYDREQGAEGELPNPQELQTARQYFFQITRGMMLTAELQLLSCIQREAAATAAATATAAAGTVSSDDEILLYPHARQQYGWQLRPGDRQWWYTGR